MKKIMGSTRRPNLSARFCNEGPFNHIDGGMKISCSLNRVQGQMRLTPLSRHGQTIHVPPEIHRGPQVRQDNATRSD
jgi:hypothetical protein